MAIMINGWWVIKPQALKYAETVVKPWLGPFCILLYFKKSRKSVIIVQENTNADLNAFMVNQIIHALIDMDMLQFLYILCVKAVSKFSPRCQDGKALLFFYLLSLKVTVLSGRSMMSLKTLKSAGVKPKCPHWCFSYNPVNGLNAVEALML